MFGICGRNLTADFSQLQFSPAPHFLPYWQNSVSIQSRFGFPPENLVELAPILHTLQLGLYLTCCRAA